MPQVPGTNKVNIEFHLTPTEQLHCFTQWREKNPGVSLEGFNPRKYLNAIREVLAEKGWQAVTARLPEHVELKKLDYKATLKGIVA
jgi:hypothetical protein